MTVLLKFSSEEFVKFVVEVLEKVGFLVAHGAIDVNALNFSILEDFFQECSFTRCSRSIDEEVHSGFKEPGESIFIRDHLKIMID